MKTLVPCDVCSFVAQSHTPCNCCVRFATTVASGHATLATKRTLLLTWAGLHFHRLDRTSFAWRTHSITSSVRALLHWTKFLHAAPKADLRGVEGALRINRNVVHPLELAGLAPLAAPLREQLSILARKRVDLAIGAVGDEDELLLRIDRQHQVPDRAVGERLGFDPEFLHKGAILAKHL